MQENGQIHYMEVAMPNVGGVCTSYSKTLNASCSEAVAELKSVRVAPLPSGGILDI